MQRRLFLGFLFCIPLISTAASFTFSDNCVRAYNEVFSLRLKSGAQYLANERLRNPDNLIPYYIESSSDFLKIVINEDRREFDSLMIIKNSRLAKIRKGNPNSPYYLYTQSEIQLLSAYGRLKFKDYLSAAFELREGYILLEENHRKFPNFKLNYKNLGMLKALIGTVPDNFKWILSIVGMEGDTKLGISHVEEFVYSTSTDAGENLYRENGEMIYALLQLHVLKNKDKSWEIINRITHDYESNLLNAFIRASVAMHTGRNDEAIRVLLRRPKGPDYINFQYLEYLTGVAKLQRLDEDADIYLRKFATSAERRTYIKEAYYKLAWHSLIFEKGIRYNHYINMVKTFGNLVVDEDKHAQKEASKGLKPDITMLKARLLFDGGYYQRSFLIMDIIDPAKMPLHAQRIEYYYRYGRLCHEMKKYKDAIQYYKRTIEEGNEMPLYYAAAASLQLGNLYESLGYPSQAADYFRKCISYTNHEFRNSFHQKAKAGLKRVNQ